MKRPTPEQLPQISMINQYSRFLEYLKDAEEDYIESLISAKDEAEMRQLQGAASTVRRLRNLIETNR